MCGIIGKINYSATVNKELFLAMRDTLIHRGPDGCGVYFSANNSSAIGHRRLALIDLTESGRQPFLNESKNLCLTCNGEIYNHHELRRELINAGHKFSSSSDNEVILHGYEEWGINVLQKLKGMFAFAIFNENDYSLIIARDRFGIKPLYYYSDTKTFIFASEIKGIIKDNTVKKELNISSVADYFTYRYVPSPNTIWNNIFKLPPAHYLFLSNTKNFTIKKYWNLTFHENNTTQQEAVSYTNELLQKSVQSHINADVPVGCFLSGGYDSSALVYYMNKLKYPVKTFSIGFKDWDKSEHRFAEIIADKFHTEHTSKILDEESLDVLNKLVYHYDEPIADISIIPTWQVSKLAASKVKTVVSGEGADEIFGGYTWHRKIPMHISFEEKIYYFKQSLFKNRNNFTIENYADAMSMGNFGYTELKQLLCPELHKHITKNTNHFYRQHYKDQIAPLKRFQNLDINTFMPELVLTKVDRASMAHSLEVRVPFLDHEIAEFVFNLPVNNYFKKNKTKFLLYENIKAHIPEVILNRSKQGFTGPDLFYMNFKWYRQCIFSGNLIKENIINKSYVEQLLTNKDHWRLWKIAVFELWFERWVTNQNA